MPINDPSTPASTSSDDSSAANGRVVVFSGDLFFVMRIRAVLRQLGYEVAPAKDAAAFSGQLATNDGRSVLGIVDFNNAVSWSALRGALASEVPILAFGAHTDVDGFRAAKAAGVARVVSNGEFNRSLPDLARKYARTPGIAPGDR